MNSPDADVPWGNAGCPGGRKIRSGGRGRGLGAGRGQGPVGRKIRSGVGDAVLESKVEKIQVIESFTKNKRPLRRRR